MQIVNDAQLQEFLHNMQRLDFFVKGVLGAKPTKQQQRPIDAIDAGEKRISIKSGHGCFGIGTKVMMHDGSTSNVEDVVVGDKLMGDDGKERNVLELYRGSETMYRFHLNDGSSYVFNESHILCLVSTQTHGRQKHGDKITITVREWLTWSDRKKRTHAFYKESLDSKRNNPLLIDPYLLGVWLGDGASRERHNIPPTDRQRNNLSFGIKSVDSLGLGEYYGFELDGNHKFLGADFFVLHNTGKSAELSWISLWAGLTKYDCKIPITAPSAPQLNLTLIPEIRRWKNVMPLFLQDDVNMKSDQIDFANGNLCAPRTARAEQPEALQGFHATNLVYLIDEASGVPENIFEVIEGALTGEHNMCIMTGNPTRVSGTFYNSFHKDKELWTGFTFNAEESDNVSQKVIARRKKQYGDDSDIYRVRVLGEFPRASSDSVFPVVDLEEACKRTEYDRSGADIWAFDVARFGDDNSQLAKRRGYEVYSLEGKHGLSTMEGAAWVAREYRMAHKKPEIIFIDTIGIGAGVYDRCLELGLPVYEANVSNKSAYEEYQNKRTEMYMELAKKIKYMKLPDDDELIGDLSAIRYQFNNKNQTALESKDDTKKRLGRSPDKGDAVAMTFFEPFFIGKEEEEEYRRDHREQDNQSVSDGLNW